MKRYWIVAQHELVTQLKRRSFLFMLFVFPVLIAGLGAFSGYMSARQGEQTGTLGQIGVVDRSGVLAAGRERPAEYVVFNDEASAAAALEEAQIGAYFVVPADYLASGVVEAYSREPIPAGIENQFRETLRANLLAQRPAVEAERLRNPAEITMATLDGRVRVDQRTGIVMIMTPVIFAILFVMSISMTSSYMMENVVEEKETRMVELLTTSITPLELLWGKMIGLGALGLLQLATWALAGGVVIALRQDVVQMLSGVHYPLWLLALAILYLFLGYILYGSLLSAIGASSTSMQEAQPIAGLFSLLGVVPMFVLVQFLENPNGMWPTFLSLLPFTAPTAMMIRLVLGQVPWWQLAVSLGLLVATVAAVIWLAAWVFRVGLLMTGQRLRPRALFQAIRQNSQRPGMSLVYTDGREHG